MACRFWGLTPHEMEALPDAQWWINEAVMIRQAEQLGEAIATDITRKKNGNAPK